MTEMRPELYDAGKFDPNTTPDGTHDPDLREQRRFDVVDSPVIAEEPKVQHQETEEERIERVKGVLVEALEKGRNPYIYINTKEGIVMIQLNDIQNRETLGRVLNEGMNLSLTATVRKDKKSEENEESLTLNLGDMRKGEIVGTYVFKLDDIRSISG